MSCVLSAGLIGVKIGLFPKSSYFTHFSWHLVQETGSATALLPADFHRVAPATCSKLHQAPFALIPCSESCVAEEKIDFVQINVLAFGVGKDLQE